MNTLSQIYSREKTLFYFAMWNDSDRLGYARFLGHFVNNNLFIIPKAGERGSVWYSTSELAEIDSKLNKRLTDPNFEKEIADTLEKEWAKILPYLNTEIEISKGEELLEYFDHLVKFTVSSYYYQEH